jgi:hypothetical protein
MNNPKALKMVIAVLVVALLVSFHFLMRAFSDNFAWKQCIELSAPADGAMFAHLDFQSDKLRLYMISGERSDDKYSGTNDGPFEIWFPQYSASPYPMRYRVEQWVAGYNRSMRYRHEHPDKFLTTTNRRPNKALEPTATAPSVSTNK